MKVKASLPHVAHRQPTSQVSVSAVRFLHREPGPEQAVVGLVGGPHQPQHALLGRLVARKRQVRVRVEERVSQREPDVQLRRGAVGGRRVGRRVRVPAEVCACDGLRASRGVRACLCAENVCVRVCVFLFLFCNTEDPPCNNGRMNNKTTGWQMPVSSESKDPLLRSLATRVLLAAGT